MFDLEKGLEELEELTSRMENNVLSVQASLHCYEKGVKLARKCEEELSKAKQKVAILQEKNGETVLSDYSVNEKNSES